MKAQHRWPESSYRREGEHVLIEVELNKLSQMFNTLDPAPFHEKDIDADAEEYIISAAREIPLNLPLKLVVYLPMTEARREDPAILADAIHHYFAYRRATARRELRLIFRQGRSSLAIGLTFLLICISAHHAFAMLQLDPNDFSTRFISEGLTISGWVAMWKPIHTFLYEWWPTVLSLRVFQKLSRIEVAIRPN